MKKIFKIGLCLIAGWAFNISSVYAEDLLKWAERINISGVVEVEAAHESMDFSDPGESDTDSSDIALATVELGIDAEINKHVSGHVVLLWEEDDTEPVDIDEGYITISGEDVVPLYLSAGKMYVPFGSFGSHFISDPITLEIGETRESAIRAGFANDMFDISLSLFNGDIDEINDDDKISTFVGSAVFTLPEGALPDLALSFGLSYISNMADTDGISGEISGPLTDSVGGLGIFLSASYMETFFIEAEYISATDRFAVGELGFDNGISYKPKAYNLEFAWAPNDALELAVRYEGSDDLGTLMPEKQFGIAASYNLCKNTSIGLEFMSGEYENGDERDLITTQLVIEF
ncbi:MAG: LbtU family siderophore porin [Deltaproteobacteria bacterium]|nr:LbtU family siderophore porin [Deltaproteobacteria bacterium]